jgi:GNAT superfamily N-acetyltransferase
MRVMEAIAVRPVERGDGAAVVAMFERCSERSRYTRFHGPTHDFPAPYLGSILEPPPGVVAVVAVTIDPYRGERVVGLASAHPATAHPATAHPATAHPATASGAGICPADIGILVEDDYQGRGIGRQLLDRLVLSLWDAGDAEIRADILAGQGAPIRLLRGRFDRLVTEVEMGVLHVRAWHPRETIETRETRATSPGVSVRDVA